MNVSDRSILKKILCCKEEIDEFWESKTGKSILSLLERLCRSVRGKTISLVSSKNMPSKTICLLLSLFDRLEDHLRIMNVTNTSQYRFGNPDFRQWHANISNIVKSTISDNIIPFAILNDIKDVVKQEFSEYLLSSFGNLERLDYGTGHELNFLIFLYCLYTCGCLTDKDDDVIVLVLFKRYLDLMRLVESTFWLEPAGSHGVWGLDDYHFLPFLFGANQLVEHSYIKPKSIHSQEILEGFHKEYLYLDCVQYINSIKTESLRWHSPLLDDISAVKTWNKVCSGLMEMYLVEVLHKKPIMQHFLIGSIVSFDAINLSIHHTQKHDHNQIQIQNGYSFPSCCGIRVPSVFASTGDQSIPRKS